MTNSVSSVSMSAREGSSSGSSSESAANSPEMQRTPHIAFFSSQNDQREANSSSESASSDFAVASSTTSSGNDAGRRRRAHYREEQVREFEGRHTPSLVWVCQKPPRSPLPGAVLTPDEKDQCYFNNVTSAGDKNASQQQQQPVEGGDISPEEITCGPLLARRPAFIHSETVPDIHLDGQSAKN